MTPATSVEASLDSRRERAAVAKAHQHLSRIINLRQIEPGRKLPSATELSHEIGVSRPSVLEALKILSSEGAVTIKRGRGGVEVLPQTGPNLAKRIDWLDANRVTIVQMALLREMVEPALARIAAERGIPKALLKSIHRTLDQLRPPLDESLARKLDHRFHRLIVEATRMPLLIDTAIEARSWVVPAFEIIRWPSSRPIDSYREHLAMLEAIVGRDPKRASEAVERHLKASTAYIVSLLGDTRRWRSFLREAATPKERPDPTIK